MRGRKWLNLVLNGIRNVRHFTGTSGVSLNKMRFAENKDIFSLFDLSTAADICRMSVNARN